MEDHKVVYLLGAGASYNALPTALTYSKALRQFAHLLISHTNSNPGIYRDTISEIAIRVNWLAGEAEKNNSVDSFAKYCYLKNRSEFLEVKKLLSCYFVYEQFIENKRDSRYNHFITDLILPGQNSGYLVRPNISILNWNYDFQVQLACDRYRKEHILPNGQKMHSLFNYYPQLGTYSITDADVKMIHLNGIAGYHQSQGDHIRYHKFDQINDFDSYFQYIKEVWEEKYDSTLLTFAFEDKESNRILRSLTEDMVKDADFLVIIGYSFLSYDNLRTDEYIFELMRDSLKKVYVQNQHSGNFLAEKFQIDARIIENIPYTHTFYIPHLAFKRKQVSEYIPAVTSDGQEF
jgi:hypothetical protein